MPADLTQVPAQVDFLVIGSGLAGLTYALHTAQHGSTLMLTKKQRTESNTNYAQGGIASVSAENDTPAQHALDTMEAGAGLCHADAVQMLVEEGPERVAELVRRGALFNRDSATGRFELGLEGGHSRNRIVHAADRTGRECERALLEGVKSAPGLHILEHFFVVDLAISAADSSRRCVGAYVLDTHSGQVHLIRARSVLLATGGLGRIYRHTTNPPVATGDGIGMAWRAGVPVANMEFIQFHPTALFHQEGGSFLISEAVRGEGGVLRNLGGEAFMPRYHPLADLAPRDVVARAIHAERLSRGEPCVYLHVQHLGEEVLRKRFPTIFARCLAVGINMATDPIPVAPAAHYACGGVPTDLDGRTELPGLYAAGEVACTGVHGANRLASNSLLEALVFGFRAAAHAVSAEAPSITEHASLAGFGSKAAPADEVQARMTALRAMMDDRVGIVRNTADLQTALEAARSELAWASAASNECKPDVDLLELRNAAQAAVLVIRSAIERKESRGLHYSTDFPERDDAQWQHDTVLRP